MTVAKKDGIESGRRYSPETMADYKMIAKVFMKFVRYGDTDKDTPYPDEVRWLRKTIKKSDEREKPYFTDQEAIDMVKTANNVMKKAFIALRAEVGPRPGDGLLLTVGDLQFDDAGALLRIRRGKTGSSTMRVISSAPYLADYLSTHPDRDAGRREVQGDERSLCRPVGRREEGPVRCPGPRQYDDPRDALFHRLSQEAANREVEREYEASRSAQKYNTMRRA